MSKLIFAELCMRNEEHIPFNSSFVELMHVIYPQHTIQFYAERNHCKAMRDETTNINVEYKIIPVISHKYWRIFLSDLISSILAIYILIRSSPNDIIILLNRLPITLMIYNFINNIYHRATISILHGELESIVNYNNVLGRTKYYYNLFKLSYLISNSNTYYVALGKTILNNILDINFRNAHLLSIDHPYQYNYINNFQQLSFPVNIGIIGLASHRKNSDKIFHIARLVYERGNTYNIHFKIAGSIDSNLLSIVNKYVDYPQIGQRLKKDEYENAISALDYSLLFYDSNTNRALASGSFFDCIKYEKPIIGIKGNEFIDYYFDRLGNIGYLFNSIDEIIAFLLGPKFYEYINSDIYREQISNIRLAKEILSLNSIAKNLKLQLDQKFNINEKDKNII